MLKKKHIVEMLSVALIAFPVGTVVAPAGAPIAPEDVALVKKYFPVYKFSAGEEWYPCSFYFDENGQDWPGDLYNKENYDSYTPFPPPYYAYVHIAENTTHKTSQYWLYYVWNYHWLWGVHFTDWDSTIFVILEKTADEPVPVEIYYFYHLSKNRLSWDSWPEYESATHPVVYVAEGSHGAYPSQSMKYGDICQSGGEILRLDDFNWYLVGDSFDHEHDYSSDMYCDMTVEWIEGELQWEFDSFWWPRKFPEYYFPPMDSPWHRSDWMRVVGDVDGDGDVDASDLFDLSEAYGSKAGDANWDEKCDFNDDAKVDVSDLFDLSKNYGKTI